MKGLLACFSVLCLSLASCAFTADESRVYSKSFDFGENEVIYSKRPFSKEEMVYAVCEGNVIFWSIEDHVWRHGKSCKVYVESAKGDRNIVQSCDLNLSYRKKFDFDVVLFNAGNSKVVFAVRNDPTRIRLINVNLKGCQIKETDIPAPMQLTREAELPLEVILIAYENSYDVIYQNEDRCRDFLCKATFDYEGRVVKALSRFPVNSSEVSSFQIVSNNHSVYLVNKVFGEASNMYLVDDYVKTSVTLFSGPRGVFGLSAEEDKLGFCMYGEQKLVCRQYDSEGKTKINEVEVAGARGLGVLFLDILNLERGLLIVSVEQDIDDNKRNIFVTHFDERGRMGKFVEVYHKCDRLKMVLPKLYKNSDGEYCISTLCAAPLDDRKNAVLSRNTRCFHRAELF